MSTKLFTLQPSRARHFGTHAESIGSVTTTNIRAHTLEADTVVTDLLVNRAGANIVVDDYLLLQETASQPAVIAGQGRLWLRNDTPNTLVFTNDAGTDVPITPALSDVLAQNNNGGGLIPITNIASLQFSDGIIIGNEAAAASSTYTSGVSVGQAAVSSAPGAIAIGAAAASGNTDAVVMGNGSAITAVGPDSNAAGGVAIGAGITSQGRSICIGRNLTCTTTNADSSEGAPILIGADIAAVTGNVYGAIAIGDGSATSTQSTVVGSNAQSLGAKQQVVIGAGASAGSIGSVAVGQGALASISGSETSLVVGNCVALGSASAATADGSVAVGFTAAASGTTAVSVGAYTVASGEASVAIGGGASPGNGAAATGDRSVAIGSGTTAAHDDAAALGTAVSTRMVNETAIRGVRTVYATHTSIDDTQFAVIDFPTVDEDVFVVEGTVTARYTLNNATFMTTWKDYHFRNRGGFLDNPNSPLADAPNNTATETISDPDGLGYVATLTVDDGITDTKVRVSVTGVAGHETEWTAVIRIYGSPLA